MIYVKNIRKRDISYSEELQNVLDYAELSLTITPPNAPTLRKMDKLIRNLVAEGIWGKLDVFFLFGYTSSVGFKRINLINPKTATDATFYGGLEWLYKGVKGNGVNAYIDSNFKPSEDAINYTKDDASIFLGVTEATGTNVLTVADNASFSNYIATRILTGGSGTNGASINSRGSLGVFTGGGGVDNTGAGMKYLGRLSSEDILIMNKDSQYYRLQDSTEISAGNQTMFRRENTYYNFTLNCFGMGAYLTPAEVNTLRALVNEYYGIDTL